MKRSGAPVPSGSNKQHKRTSNLVVDEVATDLAAFQNDLERVRSAAKQREESDIPDIKSPDHFSTILEAFKYLRSLLQLNCSSLLTGSSSSDKVPFPPIVWRHHLYALFSSHTKVDSELKSLCDSNQLRVLNVATSTRNADIIIEIDDFVNYFTAQKKIYLFISKVLKRHTKTKYSVEELKEAGFGELAIPKLMQLGLLTNTDTSLSLRQLSFPGLGVFTRTLHQGRKALLALIRKHKYSQVLQSDLLLRPIPRCSASPGKDTLGIELHLYDLYGANLVVTERQCTDVLIRLIDR
ncbi:Serine/threonine-protein kinase 19 [Tyrophagus putrescentiae]|nr:Serine/threonine-protein kinase 19 [Tyrophagus putrescentiae]